MSRPNGKRCRYGMGLRGERKGPLPYVCGQCGAEGVKLWREYLPLLEHQQLTCAKCATQEHVDESGYRESDLGRTGQIGWCVPAVPAPGGTFWGYTSVPDSGVAWWRALPTYLQLPNISGGVAGVER